MALTAHRHTMSALAALAFIAVFASSPVAQGRPLEAKEVIVTLSRVEFSRVCINGVSPQGSSEGEPSANPIIWLIYDSLGDLVLERELRAPVGGFQCIDIPYAELVAAGLPPDPTTGAVTFRVDILSSVGGSNRLSGAIMNISADTGKIELYQGLMSCTGGRQVFR